MFGLRSFDVPVLVGALVLGTGAPAVHSELPNDATRLARSSTVLIRAQRTHEGRTVVSAGTGFFVGPRGCVLTAADVVARKPEPTSNGARAKAGAAADRITVVVSPGTAGERSLEATVAVLDAGRGLALLTVPTRPEGWYSVPQVGVEVTNPLWVVGFRMAQGLTTAGPTQGAAITEMSVVGFAVGEAGEVEGMEFARTLDPGAVGAPVLDSSGTLVGIVDGGGMAPGTGFTAVACAPMREFLGRNRFRVQVEPTAVGTRPSTLTVTVNPVVTELAELAGLFTLAAEGSPTPETRVPAVDGVITASLRVPPALGAGPQAREFTVGVRLVDEAGREESKWVLKVENTSQRVVDIDRAERLIATERPAAMPATAASTGKSVGVSSDENPNSDKGLSPLSRLARNVKLNKGADGQVVVTQDSVFSTAFRPLEANYAALTPEEKSLALKLDEAFHLCTSARTVLSKESGWKSRCEAYLRQATPSSYHSYPGNGVGSWESRQRVRCGQLQTLEAQETRQCEQAGGLARQAELVGICRCEGGEWQRSAKPRCATCEVPYPTDGSKKGP